MKKLKKYFKKLNSMYPHLDVISRRIYKFFSILYMKKLNSIYTIFR